MLNFLTTFELGLLINAAVFALTLVFSQKIKDWLHGVPGELRTGMKTVEQGILADVKSYQSSLIHKLAPSPAPTTPPVVVQGGPAPTTPPPAA